MKFDVTSLAAMSRANGIQAYVDTVKEIKDATLPMLRQYGGYMSLDPAVMKIASESNRALTGSATKPWPEAVAAVFERHLLQEAEIEDLIGEIVPKNADIETLDSRSAQLAVYIDTLGYFSSYARSLIVMEIDVACKAKKVDTTTTLSVGEHQDVQKGFPTFRVAFGFMSSQSKENIVKLIKATPDYVVSDADIEAMHATYGKNKNSPLAQGFISADWNPIFKIRSIFNNRLIKRYHVAKEERQNLEFTIQVLKDNMEGQENPALQRELEYHTGRLKRLRTEMNKIEDEAK